eukprot:TRINITY_DN68154_c0_g1_i1.p1 TRINITY_DN68154_c0_g1~~TRINITY_DN68154_c0_g1_i1.p1  ORF type:complete len:257 (-),score=44.27 TRINITY_DN68154_c0_g1_i1:54-773(-)
MLRFWAGRLLRPTYQRPRANRHSRQRCFCSPGGDMGPAFAPIQELQAAFDEVLARPWRFPSHIQRLHHMAEAERCLRQPIVDQSSIAHGKSSLFAARKVVYAIVSRDNPRFQVCVTKFSCAQDFLERSSRELRRVFQGSAVRPPAKRRRGAASQGLALQGPEGLLIYALESLESDRISYHRVSHQRLHHWAGLLRGIMSSSPASASAEVSPEALADDGGSDKRQKVSSAFLSFPEARSE